jgi:hypothetical protein
VRTVTKDKSKLDDSGEVAKNTNDLHSKHVETEKKNSGEKASPKERQQIWVPSDTYALVAKLAEKREWTLSDTVTELYNSYPWHVLACEDCQKKALDDGLVISTKEDLSDVLDKERARYFVMGYKKYDLKDLPEGVRSMINVN